jgi:uncharacterized protein
MKNYSLPTRKECFDIINKYHVPPNIVKHSLATAKLAVFLAEKLKEKDTAVDVELVERACLLHDVARICEVKESDYNNIGMTVTEQEKTAWDKLKTEYKAAGHEDTAYKLLKEQYPVLALAIKKHRYLSLLDENDRPDTWEEKIVYYADKRVMHERIVSLKERLDDAHQRNAQLRQMKGQNNIDTDKVDRLIFELEEEIFTAIGLDPAEITEEFIDSHSHQSRQGT